MSGALHQPGKTGSALWQDSGEPSPHRGGLRRRAYTSQKNLSCVYGFLRFIAIIYWTNFCFVVYCVKQQTNLLWTRLGSMEQQQQKKGNHLHYQRFQNLYQDQFVSQLWSSQEPFFNEHDFFSSQR